MNTNYLYQISIITDRIVISINVAFFIVKMLSIWKGLSFIELVQSILSKHILEQILAKLEGRLRQHVFVMYIRLEHRTPQ